MIISGVYTITNLVDGKMYVGYAKDIEHRRLGHFHKLSCNKHHNKYLQNAYNKYGEENFKFEILEECSEEYMSTFENYWCNLLHTHNKNIGYNIQPTNPERKVRKLTEEEKEIIGKSSSRKMSEETKNKIREKAIGRKMPEWYKPYIPTKEDSKKAADARKEAFLKRAKKIGQFNLKGDCIKVFKNILEAEKAGYNKDKIYGWLKKKVIIIDRIRQNTFIWRYVEQDIEKLEGIIYKNNTAKKLGL